ncbi:Uma2 family endonuclease [Streptomyces luteireticuli]|uniref:Uma2 family endonuclease n=1 Tax=Streptomyces luteireticuli TaxID=173858 RepID=A0ABP3ISI7_9ACTN
MTPRPDEHFPLLLEEFEELALAAPETVRLELINRRLAVKRPPDGGNSTIVAWLTRQFLRHNQAWGLYLRGLRTGADRLSRVRPDGVLAPRGRFLGDGEWSDPDGVLMTMDVVTHDEDADPRNRADKRDGYAAAGIPVHLLVDRDDCTVFVYSEPEDGRYRSLINRAYGEAVELPAPVGFTLETRKLKDFAD